VKRLENHHPDIRRGREIYSLYSSFIYIMLSIDNYMQKIKQFADETILGEKGRSTLVVLIVILVGFSAFEIGRLSRQNSTDGVKIQYPGELSGQAVDQTANITSAAVSATALTAKTSSSIPAISKPATSGTQNFFASSRGSKYYPAGCSAGKSLKQENRVYFATRQEAEKAGYELSSSCR
jgi:hypothetical protein